MEETGEPCLRPADFDLAEAWEEISATIEEMRTPQHVDAVVESGMVGVLRWMFDRQLTVLTESVDGEAPQRLRIRIGGHSVERIAQQVAGFGAHIEVTGPPEARAALAQVGRHLVDAYER